MKFSSYGYLEKEIKVREMSVGAVILTVTQAMVKADKTEIELRIIDCTSGTVDRYKGIEAIINSDWNVDYRINVYDMCMMNDENGCFIKVIISDDVE